jgi:hypothetical protein
MKLVCDAVGTLTSREMQYVYLLQVLDEKRFVWITKASLS